MLRSAFPARVALDADIVWRVGEDARGLLVAKQRFIGPRVECVAAQDAMVIQKPQVAKLGYGWPRRGFKFVCGVRVRRLQRLNVQIDLRSLETRRLDLEIERDFGKLLQNDRDLAIVPGRPVGQLVVGEHIGFGLRVGQMLEADDGQLSSPSRFAASRRPWPATIRFMPSIRIGAVKPNVSILRAIARICSGECFRGLLESGTIDPMGW